MRDTEYRHNPRGLLAEPGPADLDAVRRFARAAADDGFGAVWFRDGAADGGACAFVLATWAAAADQRLLIGVWASPGLDHPIRFAEEFAVLDLLSGGRALAGLSRAAQTDADWLLAVSTCWEAESLELSAPVRVPARDPANVWVPEGWTPKVTPRPSRPVQWWADERAVAVPTGLAHRPCRLSEAPGGRTIVEAVA